MNSKHPIWSTQLHRPGMFNAAIDLISQAPEALTPEQERQLFKALLKRQSFCQRLSRAVNKHLRRK